MIPREPPAGTTDEEILEAAVARPAAERAEFLDQACGPNAAQRARLAALLQGHSEAGDFLTVPAVSRPPLLPRENAGDLIDRYRLVEKIGDGGCGVVWTAEQLEPLRRKVAFKIIKLGMNTRTIVARFEAERQALAMMDHPNIARVFDAGVTSTGRPYFVMELVAGIPITKYCDQHRLTTAQRLELFIQVCEAVQHAHQKGIVHRDLKPSNILVANFEGSAVPKVIDFGIAKAVQMGGSENAMPHAEQFAGTPAYMSPEQAGTSELDVDTRSDIYSLGVLLFELLTGSLPFDAKSLGKGSLDDLRRRLQETPPEPLSTKLRTLTVEEQTHRSELRSTTPRDLSGALRGDIGWIVMRCLEKDRNRRYDSASALAADVRRSLRHEPITALPWTPLYLAQRFVARHRLKVIFVSAIVLAVVAGAGISTWLAVRATRAEQAQNRLRRQAETQELSTRRRAYAADMNLAQQALEDDNLGQAKRLLSRYQPKPGEPDLRGWEWRYLWQQCRSEAVEEVAHLPSPVSWLAASRDGEWLGIGQEDGGQLRIRNTRTREEIQLTLGVGATRIAFSPTAPLVALAFTARREGSAEHRLRLWNLATRETIAEWPTASQPGPLFFSSDGATLVAVGGGRASPIDQWRIPSGEKIATLPATGGPICAVMPDLSLMAREIIRDGRSLIQVLDPRTGRQRWLVYASDESISALAFSPDGKFLASANGYTNSDIRIWDAASGKRVRKLRGHRTFISALAFSPSGKTLVSVSKDQTVRLWEPATGWLRRTFRGHQLEVHSLAFLGNEESFVSGSKDGFVLRWSTTTPAREKFVRLDDAVASWAFTPDGSGVVTLDSLGNIVHRSGPSFSEPQPCLAIEPPRRGSQSTVFAHDAPLLAVVVESGEVQIVDWQARQRINVLRPGNERLSLIGFTPGGASLILAQRSGATAGVELQAWDVKSGRETRSWPGSEAAPQPFTLSADARFVACRGGEGTVSVLDLVSGTETPLQRRGSLANSLALSPDNGLVAAASGIGLVRVWQLGDASPAAELAGFVLGVHSAAFSPDSKRLITGSGNNQAIRVWDAESFEPLVTLPAQGPRFSITAMSPNGDVIGSRNASGRVYFWRAPSLSAIDETAARR